MERAIYDAIVVGWFALAGIVAVALTRIVAPYGRHARAGWGPTVASRTGWLVMELPAALAIVACFALAPPATVAPWIFLALWELHYANRAVVYPLRMTTPARPMPLAVAALGATFNLVNGYLNGRWITAFASYPRGYLLEPRFLGGAAIMLAGWAINLHADAILRRLRPPGDATYRIPHGGLYRWVSCPNYLGEIVEWFGWALLTWSPGALAFAVWTAANLAPRARAHHRWYRATFADYPPARRALVPFVF